LRIAPSREISGGLYELFLASCQKLQAGSLRSPEETLRSG
jgi:hypothetical protein